MGGRLGESDLRWVCVICRVLYSIVAALGFRGEGCEDLTFRGSRAGVGRGRRVGGRAWAWWSGKALGSCEGSRRDVKGVMGA